MGFRKVNAAEVRHEVVADAAKATPLAAYLVSILNGVDWPSIAALLAAVYTMLLLLEKAYKLYKWLTRPRVRHDPADE
jgi:hypothetical protein